MENLTSSVLLLIVVSHLVAVVIHRLAAPCRRLRFSHRLSLFLMAGSATIVSLSIGQQLLVGKTIVDPRVVNVALAIVVLSLTTIAFGPKRLIYRRKPACQNLRHSLVKTSSMR